MNRKIICYVHTNKQGSRIQEEIDIVDDWNLNENATEEQIKECFDNWLESNMECGWYYKDN